jgi:E3 ubiquitin-protein ligase HUWE1
MWDSDFMDKASDSIAKSIIEIIRIILDGRDEMGAYRRNEKVPVRGKPPHKNWRASSEHVSKLIDASYSKDLAQEALFRCNNAYTFALEYCKAQTKHKRATRNPVPESEMSQEKSKPRSRSSEVRTSTPSGGQSQEGSANAPPQSGQDGSAVLHPPQVEEAGQEPRTVTPPPPAPTAPIDEDIDSEFLRSLAENGFRERFAAGFGSSERNGLSPSPARNPVNSETAEQQGIPNLDDLDDERKAIRGNLVERCLDVVHSHGDVTFELADLLTDAVTKGDVQSMRKESDGQNMRKDIGQTLVQSLMSLSMDDDDFRHNGKKIAAYAHLIALVLQNKEFYDATLDEIKEYFDSLLGFIKLFPDHAPDEPSPWVANVLLIIEKLLSEDAQPTQVEWTPPTSDSDPPSTPIVKLGEPIVSDESKSRLFDSIVEILPRIGKDEALALAVVRVLAILTRNRILAVKLGEKRNMQRLFVMVKQLAGKTSEKLQSSVMLVLRHIVEDETTIRQIMQTEIKYFFTNRQQRHHDTSSYLRSLSHVVIRDPDLFVKVTMKL